MKNLNITFDDATFKRLMKAKEKMESQAERKLSWEQFICLLVKI